MHHNANLESGGHVDQVNQGRPTNICHKQGIYYRTGAGMRTQYGRGVCKNRRWGEAGNEIQQMREQRWCEKKWQKLKEV